MQQVVTDNQLDLSSSSSLPTPTSSSPPSSVDTPAFTPNIPSYDLPSEYVSMKSVLASLSRKPQGTPTLEDVIIPDLDLSMPVSSLLRIGTSRAHVRAEHSDGAKALVKGDLTLEEYIRWLVILWRVYSALELSLSEHDRNPALAPTYHPQTFARAPALARDISYLLTRLPSRPITRTKLQPPEDAPLPPFPVPDFLMPIFTLTPPPLATYITHLRDLAMSGQDAPLLLAHSYVRYLGDLSGGQYIATKTRQAFGLHGDEGLEFYKFEMMGDEGPMRVHQIKEWFREGMNSGVQNDEVLKERLVKEANLAFALNVHLFSLIRQTTTLSPPSSLPRAGLPPSTIASSSIASTISTPTRIPTHNAKGEPLRYYERRQLEQEAKERERKAAAALEPKRTWTQTFERFSVFALAVGLTLGFSQYGWPWMSREVVPRVRDYADQRGWLDHDLVSRLLGENALLGGTPVRQNAESVVTAASAVVASATKSVEGVVEPVKSTVEATASSIASTVKEQVEDWTTAAVDASEVINSVLNDLTATTTGSVQTTTTATVTETIHDEPSPTETGDHGALEDIASTAAEVHSATLDEEPVEDFAEALTSVMGEEPVESETVTESVAITAEATPGPTAAEEASTTPLPEVQEEEESMGSPVEDGPPDPEPEREFVEDYDDVPLETGNVDSGEEAIPAEDEDVLERLRDEL